MSVGDSVYVEENGINTEFVLVHKGLPSGIYDQSCSGAWLVRKDAYGTAMAWDANGNYNWNTSTIKTWLNSTYLGYLNMSSSIKQVKIPYSLVHTSTTYTGSNGSDCKVFLLGAQEVGWQSGGTALSDTPYDGARLDYFPEYLTGNAVRGGFAGWIRSVTTSSTEGGVFQIAGGGQVYTSAGSDSSNNIHPTFIVPLDTPVDSNNNIVV